eukprot:gene184-4430_t
MVQKNKEEFIFLEPNNEMYISGEINVECIFGSCNFILGFLHGYHLKEQEKTKVNINNSILIETLNFKTKKNLKKSFENKISKEKLKGIECILFIKYKKISNESNDYLSEEYKLKMNDLVRIDFKKIILSDVNFYTISYLINKILNNEKEIIYLNFDSTLNGIIFYSKINQPILFDYHKFKEYTRVQFIGNHFKNELYFYFESIKLFLNEINHLNNKVIIQIPKIQDEILKQEILSLLNSNKYLTFDKLKVNLNYFKNYFSTDLQTITISFKNVLISLPINLDKDLIYQSLYLLNNSIIHLGYKDNFKNESSSLPLFCLKKLRNIKHIGFGKIIKIDFKNRIFHISIPLFMNRNEIKNINVLNYLKKNDSLSFDSENKKE